MRKIFISLAAVTLLATTACSDFLDIQPVSAVSEAKLLNPAGVEMIKTGMYSTLYASSIQQSLASVGYGDVIAGNANKEIADKLNISTHTVISHRKNISQKTGIKSVSGLTIYAVVKNIITIDSYRE